MPRKGRRRSAAQIHNTENMRNKRWPSPGQMEEMAISEEARRNATIEGHKSRMMRAEREVERARKDLRNAERRVSEMTSELFVRFPSLMMLPCPAGKIETAKRKARELKEELAQLKERFETATVDCAHWKDRTAELQCLLRKNKGREYRGPTAIHKAVRSGIAILINTGGKPLPIPEYRIEGRIYELVNELFFTWRLPTVMMEGVICSVSQAAVEVCCGGDFDDIDIEMGEHYEFDESKFLGTPVPDAAVVGSSNAAVPPPSPPQEAPNMEENP